MHAVWTVLCRLCAIDRGSNNLSLFEVVEALQLRVANPAPGAFVQREMCLVTLLVRSGESSEKHHVRFRVQSPAGEYVPVGAMLVDFKEHKRFRAVMRFGGLPFLGVGTYWFSVEIVDGDSVSEIARVPVQVETIEVADTNPG